MTTTTTTTQSIFTILDSLKTSTSVPGQQPKMQAHTLPRSMFPTSEEFADKKKLVQWACKTGVIHSALQKGVQKHLIDARARFKSCKKDDVWTVAYGQKNVDNYTWEIVSKPNQNNVATVKAQAERDAGHKMAQSMFTAGVDKETIMTSLTAVYGAEVAGEIVAGLN